MGSVDANTISPYPFSNSDVYFGISMRRLIRYSAAGVVGLDDYNNLWIGCFGGAPVTVTLTAEPENPLFRATTIGTTKYYCYVTPKAHAAWGGPQPSFSISIEFKSHICPYPESAGFTWVYTGICNYYPDFIAMSNTASPYAHWALMTMNAAGDYCHVLNAKQYDCLGHPSHHTLRFGTMSYTGNYKGDCVCTKP